MMDQEAVLQRRLDQNYKDYVDGLQDKTADELIALAPEITAAQQLRDGLARACSEESLGFLLGLEDPLGFVRGYWITELTRDSCSEEMGHMLWEIQCRGEVPVPASDPAPKQTEKHKSGKKGGHTHDGR